MTSLQDLYIAGLKNAHAMENQALAIMRPQVSRIEHYPEIADRLDQHIRETEGQLSRLDQLLESAGSDHSAVKDATLSLTGTMAALGHTLAPDEIIKNSFANFAFENFEIAAYTSLLALAENGVDGDAARLLQSNLDEEVAMANWISENIAPLTLRYAALRQSSLEAKK